MKSAYIKQIREFESLHLSISDKWVLIRAYASALPDKDLLDIYCSISQNQVIKSLLARRDAKQLATIQHKTINKLLKDFAKRESEEPHLRAELLHRYDYASIKDKRRIIESLLTDKKNDRKSAYSKLYKQWDSYFAEKIPYVYDKYQDPECLKLFVKHYPKSYLQDKFDRLVEFYDYRYACYCMGPDFVGSVDRKRIADVDWLQLMVTFKQEVSPIEAERILYQTVVQCLCYDSIYYLDSEDSVMKLPDVRKAVRCVGALGLTDALWHFAQFCEQVNNLIKITDFCAPNGPVGFLHQMKGLLPSSVHFEDCDTPVGILPSASRSVGDGKDSMTGDVPQKGIEELKAFLSEDEWGKFCDFRNALAEDAGE